MSPELSTAFYRALVIGLIAGATTALTTWSQTNDPKAIAIAGLTAFLAPFATRFVGEGSIDTAQANGTTILRKQSSTVITQPKAPVPPMPTPDPAPAAPAASEAPSPEPVAATVTVSRNGGIDV